MVSPELWSVPGTVVVAIAGGNAVRTNLVIVAATAQAMVDLVLSGGRRYRRSCWTRCLGQGRLYPARCRAPQCPGCWFRYTCERPHCRSRRPRSRFRIRRSTSCSHGVRPMAENRRWRSRKHPEIGCRCLDSGWRQRWGYLLFGLPRCRSQPLFDASLNPCVALHAPSGTLLLEAPSSLPSFSSVQDSLRRERSRTRRRCQFST